MAELIGRIGVVQETRFRLTTPSGQSFLLTLGHNADVDAGDLHRYQRESCDVRVEYSGEPGLSSGVAHSIRREE
jgi:hypothetical protein